MVFCDLMNRLKTTELNTMNASTFLHNMLRAVTPNSIHKARFNTKIDKLIVQLKNICSILKKSNKVRMYSITDNKYFIDDEINTLKYLGVVGLRSTLNNSNEKKRLSRNLAKNEVKGFGDKLIGGSLAELQKLKRLLLKP